MQMMSKINVWVSGGLGVLGLGVLAAWCYGLAAEPAWTPIDDRLGAPLTAALVLLGPWGVGLLLAGLPWPRRGGPSAWLVRLSSGVLVACAVAVGAAQVGGFVGRRTGTCTELCGLGAPVVTVLAGSVATGAAVVLAVSGLILHRRRPAPTLPS
jgi:hypothetical protein